MKKYIIALSVLLILCVSVTCMIWLNAEKDYDLTIDGKQYENVNLLRQYNDNAIKRRDIASVVDFLNDIPLCEDRKNMVTQETSIYNISLQNKNGVEEYYQIRAGEDYNYYLRIIKDNGEKTEQYRIKDGRGFIIYADEYFENQ